MRSARSIAIVLCLLATVASAQVTISNSGTGTFVDISTTGGTAITGVGDDSAHAFVSTIGNDMFPAGNIVVTSNGYLVSGATPIASIFSNASVTPTSNGTLVGYAGATAVLLPFWDDLYGVANPNGTIWYQESGGVLTVMWKDIDHFATTGQPITFEVQIFQGGGCNPSVIQFLYPDTMFTATSAFNSGASATIGYLQGTNGLGNNQWSFNTATVPDGTVLTLTSTSFLLGWSSPSGPGSLQLNICGGPANGAYILAVTFNQGAYPAGWFFGIDILPQVELAAQLAAGFPFVGPLDGTGSFVLGPFSNLPSNLTFYAVGLGIVSGGFVPTAFTDPTTYTIP